MNLLSLYKNILHQSTFDCVLYRLLNSPDNLIHNFKSLSISSICFDKLF